MTYRPTFLLPVLLPALFLILALTGCDSNDEKEEPPPASPPTFAMSSRNVKLGDGGDGITFSARPSEDVILVRVEISNPEGNSVTFNAGSTTVVKGEAFALQDAGIAYYRVSGTWRFEFVGRRATGDQTSFTSTTTVNVSA